MLQSEKAEKKKITRVACCCRCFAGTCFHPRAELSVAVEHVPPVLHSPSVFSPRFYGVSGWAGARAGNITSLAELVRAIAEAPEGHYIAPLQEAVLRFFFFAAIDIPIPYPPLLCTNAAFTSAAAELASSRTSARGTPSGELGSSGTLRPFERRRGAGPTNAAPTGACWTRRRSNAKQLAD